MELFDLLPFNLVIAIIMFIVGTYFIFLLFKQSHIMLQMVLMISGLVFFSYSISVISFTDYLHVSLPDHYFKYALIISGVLFLLGIIVAFIFGGEQTRAGFYGLFLGFLVVLLFGALVVWFLAKLEEHQVPLEDVFVPYLIVPCAVLYFLYKGLKNPSARMYHFSYVFFFVSLFLLTKFGDTLNQFQWYEENKIHLFSGVMVVFTIWMFVSVYLIDKKAKKNHSSLHFVDSMLTKRELRTKKISKSLNRIIPIILLVLYLYLYIMLGDIY